jgi:copper chaperone CopZ
MSSPLVLVGKLCKLFHQRFILFFIQDINIKIFKIMKTVKIILVVLIATFLGANTYAQSNQTSKVSATKTETIKVSGNCDMCKARIEKAAKFDGVSKAEWDKKSKILSVTFDPSKTNMEIVGKKLAAAGHDTEKLKADDKAYSALPSCCKYR